MIEESNELNQARAHLQLVEASLSGEHADYHLEEGLYLLDDLVEGGTDEAVVARNLGAAYVAKLLGAIEQLLTPRDVPEPTLKHLMRLSQILSASQFAENHDVPTLTARIATRYIDSVFEGYKPEDKARAIAQLMEKLDAG